MPSAAAILMFLAGMLTLLVAAVFVFGLPPELKRRMQVQALKMMGENKASYLIKDQVSKIPDSDQQTVRDVKQGLGNALGGAINNPLGNVAGDAGDDLTRPFTGH